MLKTLISIAGVTVGFCLMLIACSVLLNAWGTVSGDFIYPLQMEILRWAFSILGVSTTVLSLGGLIQIRMSDLERAELEQAFEQEREATVPPGKELIRPEDIPKAMQSIETVAIAAQKFDTRSERLNDLYKKPAASFNGEISIIPGEVLLPPDQQLHKDEI